MSWIVGQIVMVPDDGLLKPMRGKRPLWLKCNGKEFNEKYYTELYELLGKNQTPVITGVGVTYYIRTKGE